MSVWVNIGLHLLCLWRDVRACAWGKVRFHLAGFMRALKMAIEQISERAGGVVAFVGGASGFAGLWVTAWNVMIGAAQAILLILSIISVLMACYIGWPKFLRAWRRYGGLRAFLPRRWCEVAEKAEDDSEGGDDQRA